VATLVVGIIFDGGGEERVNEGGLSESGFTSNLRKSEVMLERSKYKAHTMMVKLAPRFATILCLFWVRLLKMVSTPKGCIPLVGQL